MLTIYSLDVLLFIFGTTSNYCFLFCIQISQEAGQVVWYSHILKNFLQSILSSKSCSVISDSLQPCELYSPRNSPGQNTEMGSLSLLQGIFPTQGSNPGLPHCRQIFLPAEPQGKPKNTGVGSLSFLQWIFPTQELNRGLLASLIAQLIKTMPAM